MTTALAERPPVDVPANPPLLRSGPLEVAFDLKAIKARLGEIKAFLADPEIMVPGVDYGKVPGTDNIALMKSGAEKLAEFYGVIQRPRVNTNVERWEDPVFFHREYELDLISRRDGYVLGTGIGSCNSKESRYRWRNAERVCPDCGVAAIIKGKPEYGGGFVCFKRKNGCGAKFTADDPKIVDQKVGRVENDDIPTLHNTIIKMAKKRALVDGIVSITRSAGLLVEVAEEEEDDDHGHGSAGVDRGNRSTATGGSAPRGNGEPVCDESERKRLNEAFTKAGHKFPDVVAYVKAAHDIDLTRQPLPRRLFEDVLAKVSQPEPLVAPAGETGEMFR